MQRRATILLVEDGQTLRETLAYNLTREGYDVQAVGEGQAALDAVQRERPDLVILDLTLPDLDGLDVCRAIRRETSTPILVLSARASELDTVLGLEFGADHYVTKPFELRPLLSRIKALLRRAVSSAPSGKGQVQFGDFVFDPAGRRLYRDKLEITLTEGVS